MVTHYQTLIDVIELSNARILRIIGKGLIPTTKNSPPITILPGVKCNKFFTHTPPAEN